MFKAEALGIVGGGEAGWHVGRDAAGGQGCGRDGERVEGMAYPMSRVGESAVGCVTCMCPLPR